MEIKNKINWITTRPLTMDKWDNLLLILRENKLEELTNDMYKNKDQNCNMVDTIWKSAIQWRANNPGSKIEIVD